MPGTSTWRIQISLPFSERNFANASSFLLSAPVSDLHICASICFISSKKRSAYFKSSVCLFKLSSLFGSKVMPEVSTAV